MRTIAVLGLACTTLIGAGLATESRAADLDPAVAPAPAYGDADPQFEFGTGWYLRGDASFAPEDNPVLERPATTKQDWNYLLGGGIGYKFNSFVRVDVTGDYFGPKDYTSAALDPVTGKQLVDANGAGVYNKAKLQKFDGLANVYIDLGTWYGLTPYIGGGAGFAVYDPSEQLAVVKTGKYLADNVGSKTKFAWAGMAGVSYQFDQNVVVDIGYRHIDLGRFSTSLVGYTIDHRFTEDQVRIGLRYMIF